MGFSDESAVTRGPFGDLFSKRKAAKERQGQPDVYQYDELSEAFRNQVWFILSDAIGFNKFSNYYNCTNYWMFIHNHLCREKGLLGLSKARCDYFKHCFTYLKEASTDDALDLIEVAFRVVDGPIRNLLPYQKEDLQLTNADDSITELNYRFREHGIGYQFSSGIIMRMDSVYTHSEMVLPALRLLTYSGELFLGPLDEFIDAHRKYRKGESKEAIISAHKSLESTLKSICNAMNWQFDQDKATCKDLLDIVFAKDLIPTFLTQQFSSLRSVLESGVPPVRNRKAGHGQGSTPTQVPEFLTAYALHMTASNIVFLIEAFKARESEALDDLS